MGTLALNIPHKRSFVSCVNITDNMHRTEALQTVNTLRTNFKIISRPGPYVKNIPKYRNALTDL